jgi:hypothetical protein
MSSIQNQFANRYRASPIIAPAPSGTSKSTYMAVAVFTLVLTAIFLVLSLPQVYDQVAKLLKSLGINNLFQNNGKNSMKLVLVHTLVFYLLTYLYVYYVTKNHK